MKKIIVLIALVIAPAVTFGQSMFDKLENMDEVSSFIINKDAFQLLQKFNPDMSGDNEAVEVFKMIQNLKELKVFKTSNANVAKTMETMVTSAVKKSNLTELMRMKDKDARVKIYVKTNGKKDYVSEVLMYVNGVSRVTEGNAESVIVSLTGMIDINKLSSLADKFAHDGKKS
ncbi:hypothetical protein KCTC32516_02063 [Polaribacter huanghezhanensis]|uniref:DUF4252 domain-containing protein n=1 Tax=Polaribacter huanghezhanensis TaxID=1354726 RepID=UPI00264793A0|nr:DUF4252 domain-containing protein [Polaribacter huanghezhanensis]WKD86687.1 hypothetical protein KCTC32516_02063 [Polaribacter huanghezhanensis]